MYRQFLGPIIFGACTCLQSAFPMDGNSKSVSIGEHVFSDYRHAVEYNTLHISQCHWSLQHFGNKPRKLDLFFTRPFLIRGLCGLGMSLIPSPMPCYCCILQAMKSWAGPGNEATMHVSVFHLCNSVLCVCYISKIMFGYIECVFADNSFHGSTCCKSCKLCES